jgi:hypothetical protein
MSEPARTKKLILHIEVPDIHVEDLTDEAIRDMGGDPSDPADMVLVVCTDALSLEGVVVLNHDDVGGPAMTGHRMFIIGAQIAEVPHE